MNVLLPADIGDSAQRFTDTVGEWLPRLIGALVILLVGWLIAKAVRTLLMRLLPNTGMDRAVFAGTAGEAMRRNAPGFRPSALIATVAFWLILLTALLLALGALGIPALDSFIANAINYLPNVIAAILIVVAAIALAGLVGAAVKRFMGDTVLGRIVGTTAPAFILVVAGFMALVQLRIAVPIVTGAFYIVLGGIALGAAIAFGLGGQGAARRLMDDAYEKGRAEMPRMRAEAQVARARAQAAAADNPRILTGDDDTPQFPPPGVTPA
ncbi:MAG: transporter [Thermoleophilia bacterium]